MDFRIYDYPFCLFILRFFIGMGLGGELPVASNSVSESVSAKERGRVVVLLESFWALGWLIAALISYFVIPSFGWRVALILSALPAFLLRYLFTAESSGFSKRFHQKRRRNGRLAKTSERFGRRNMHALHLYFGWSGSR